MGKIDSISQALQTEHGIDLSTGKYVLVDDHNMEDPVLLPKEIVEQVTGELVNSSPEIQQIQQVDQVEQSSNKTVEHIQDEENVKRNIRELIRKGMDLADDMFEIVRVSESPKAFEPASAYLKTLVELNEKLLDIHDRDRKPAKGGFKSKEETAPVVNTTNNNTVICTDPAELLKALKNKK